MTQELELDCLHQLEATPAILRGLMCGLSVEDTEWKPAPDRFSVAGWPTQRPHPKFRKEREI
jgi:hypothetical protein